MTDEAPVTGDEMLTVTAARRLVEGAVCFIGVGLPSEAAAVARAVHAPELHLVYESGAIDAKPTYLPLSIADSELAETATALVSVPEMFAYWLQGGRIDVGVLGAGQVDRFGNVNSTVIGDYAFPKVRLPGAGGAPEIAAAAKQTLILLRHTRRGLVPALDFRSTVGFGDGAGDRARLGLLGHGVAAVITDLGVLEPDPDTCELVLVATHPGVVVTDVLEATGWELKVAPHVATTPAPSVHELAAVRALTYADGRSGS
jgi:glutaconate CoA-transferase subunit B